MVVMNDRLGIDLMMVLGSDAATPAPNKNSKSMQHIVQMLGHTIAACHFGVVNATATSNI
jgi:hypothetical protein